MFVVDLQLKRALHGGKSRVYYIKLEKLTNSQQVLSM